MQTYPHLFEPLRVKNMVFRNRVFFGPVQMSAIDGHNYPTDDSVTFFGRRAKGGAAAVVVGDTPVDSMYAPNNYRHFVLDDPGTLPKLTSLTDCIRFFGAVPSIELNHAGAVTHPNFLKGASPIGPVEYQRPDGVLVQGMNEELMHYTIESYCRAAAFAKLAGFCMCTICASDGWLLHQFLSPATNRRKDRFGGGVQERMRFPLEVIRAVRQQVGDDFLLELRLCADDALPNGIRIEEAVAFAQASAPYVDMIQVVAGADTSNRAAARLKPTIFSPFAPHEDLAAAIKASVNLPVVLNGSVMRPESAERIIAEGKADAVSMCRALIAEPDLPDLARRGREAEIRPCIRCLRCLGDMQRTKQFRCAINPYCGREALLERFPGETNGGRVLVIGGGPAGMIAALSAADRGAQVTLFEKNDRLGGSLNHSEKLPYRGDLVRYRDYLIGRVLRHRNISVVLDVEMTPALAKAQRPDGLIVAIGARPSVPQKIRKRMDHVMDERDLYDGEPPEGSVVVIGAGESGCDAAIYLASHGASVTLLERRPTILPREQPMMIGEWQRQLDNAGVSVRTGVNCVSISQQAVVAVDLKTQTKLEIPADTVVFATGGSYAIDLVENYRDAAPEFAAVGSCVHKSDLKQTVFDSYSAGHNI